MISSHRYYSVEATQNREETPFMRVHRTLQLHWFWNGVSVSQHVYVLHPVIMVLHMRRGAGNHSATRPSFIPPRERSECAMLFDPTGDVIYRPSADGERVFRLAIITTLPAAILE